MGAPTTNESFSAADRGARDTEVEMDLAVSPSAPQ